jgi:hypothetical protein
MPIHQTFTGCIYASENGETDSNRYVANIMKEQGLPVNKLMCGYKEVFNELVCSTRAVPMYDVRHKHITTLDTNQYVQSHLVLPWMRNRNNLDGVTGLGCSMYVIHII